MRLIFSLLFLISINGFGQWKDYIISIKGDTLNRLDRNGKKQGPWWIHLETLRGERGYEEEGYYMDDRREGLWKKYSLDGAKLTEENYRWGNKNGKCTYYSASGGLLRIENWKAVNPDNPYDTVDVYDMNDPTKVTDRVVVKLDGYSLKHGLWTFYNPFTGEIEKTERYWLDNPVNANAGSVASARSDDDLQPINIGKSKTDTAAAKKIPKPKEVLEFEKKNAGKKSIKVREGKTGYSPDP